MTTAATPDDFDRLILLWADGDHAAVARSVLTQSHPDAIRFAVDLGREYDLVRPGSGASVIDGLLRALDTEHARLAAELSPIGFGDGA